VKDKPSVHNISQPGNLKIMMNESVCNGLSLTILRGVSRDHHTPLGSRIVNKKRNYLLFFFNPDLLKNKP
jgi:hypothetical protein